MWNLTIISISLEKIQRFWPKIAYGCHGNTNQENKKKLSKTHFWLESQLLCNIWRKSEDMDLSPIFHFAWILREPVLNTRGSTQVLLCLFPGVLWLWHFLCSVGPRPVSSLHIYKLLLCRGHSWRVRLGKQETLTPPGYLISPLVCRSPRMSTVVLYCWCHSDGASVLLYLHL